MTQQTNCNTKHKTSTNTCRFLIPPLQITQDNFGCTNNFFVHTYPLFGLQVHPTEHDKAHTSVYAPVRMVPGHKCTPPRCGNTWHLPVLSLCMVFKSTGCVGIPTQPLFSSLSHTIPLRCRHIPTGMQKYGFLYIHKKKSNISTMLLLYKLVYSSKELQNRILC